MKNKPINVATRGKNLKYEGRKISCVKGDNCQLIKEPEKIAPVDKKKVGVRIL